MVALSVALLLATALIYTTFSSSTTAETPSQLVRNAEPGHPYQLTGTVVDGSVHRIGETLMFAIADRAGPRTSVPVVYQGTVPDPFREGREVIVSGAMQSGSFIAAPNSLITKCPSKYNAAPPPSPGPAPANKPA